jgi:hypothetical protein
MEGQDTWWVVGLIGTFLVIGLTAYMKWTQSNITRLWQECSALRVDMATVNERDRAFRESLQRIELKLDALLVNSHKKGDPPCAPRSAGSKTPL